MIVVTGANGHLGRQIVEGLLRHVPATELGVSVRDLEKAGSLEPRGLRVRKGDFAEPAGLAEAFDGAEQILLVSVNVLGEEGVRQHGNAIQAAKEAGVKRIVYTSHQAANLESGVAFARDHAATEVMLRASGVPFVSLRNGFYAESALYQLGGMQETGRLALPEDGPVSWTARADLAEAAVAALVDPSLFDGVSPPLTASRAITFSEVARIASDILGREISRLVVSDDEYKKGLLAHGMPPSVVDLLASLFGATRAGEFNVVDPALEQILKREPVGMEGVLRLHLSETAARHD